MESTEHKTITAAPDQEDQQSASLREDAARPEGATDTTPQKTLLQSLHEMETVLQHALVAICISRDRHIVRYNAKFAEVFGFTGDQGLGLPGRAIYRSDEEYAEIGRKAGPLLAAGKSFQTELFMRRQDGSDVWINLISYGQDLADPSADTIWILEDRTEYKRIEEALLRNRDELAAITDNAMVGVLFTRDRMIQRCNQRGANIFGYGAPEDLIGKPGIIIYPDEQSYMRIGQEAGLLLAAGRSFHADWLMRKADGSTVWCKLYAKPVDPSQPALGTIWVIEDINQAKLAEQALRQSKLVLESTFEHMDQGISIFDANLKLLGTNRRFRELLDFPESLCGPNAHFADFIGYNAKRGDYGPGDIEEQVRTRVELAQRFEPHQFERERPDGTVLEIRGRPIPGGGFVTVYTDVTQRARAERALRESEARFRSLTALSSGWFWEQDAEFRFTRMEGQHISGDGSAFATELGKTYWEFGFNVKGGWETLCARLESH